MYCEIVLQGKLEIEGFVLQYKNCIATVEQGQGWTVLQYSAQPSHNIVTVAATQARLQGRWGAEQAQAWAQAGVQGVGHLAQARRRGAEARRTAGRAGAGVWHDARGGRQAQAGARGLHGSACARGAQGRRAAGGARGAGLAGRQARDLGARRKAWALGARPGCWTQGLSAGRAAWALGARPWRAGWP